MVAEIECGRSDDGLKLAGLEQFLAGFDRGLSRAFRRVLDAFGRRAAVSRHSFTVVALLEHPVYRPA